MSSQEKAEFENRINQDTALKNKVEAQKQVMDAIAKMSLKQSAKQAHSTYKAKALLTKLILLIAGLAIAGFVLLKVMSSSAENSESDIRTESFTDTLKANANSALDENVYRIQAKSDTVIENQDGVIIYIPENAFDTEAEIVELKVQSAINGADIMLAGLSTMADSNQLETGGMFYVDALANGKRVNLIKDLEVNVPTTKKIDGMMHYQGEKLPNGDINWVSPKPLAKDLTPVDISSLDFYPPNYESKLNDWGYSGKRFTDSLYYSFGFGEIEEISSIDTIVDDISLEVTGDIIIFNKNMSKDEGLVVLDDNDSLDLNLDGKEIGINPASIKTIWNSKFDHTILATKEFEERMPYIHESCNQNILNLYIYNLSKGLSEIDSMVLPLVSGNLKNKFREFASRGDGKVKLTDGASKKLKSYYDIKVAAESIAIETTKREFWGKQAKLDKKNQENKTESIQRDLNNQGDVFVKEVNKNLCKVYKELDHPYDCNNPSPPVAAAYYTLPVRNLGWHNIDRKVMIATANRSSTEFEYNGKKSSLTYENWVGELIDYGIYDQVYVYNLPKEFNSYVKLISSGNGKYSYKLNADIDYETLVLAWKDDQFYYSQTKTRSGVEKIKLKPISKASFKSKLSKRNASLPSIAKELEYIKFVHKDNKRMKSNSERRALRRKVEPVIFPCRPVAEEEIGLFISEPKNEVKPIRREFWPD